MKRLILVLALLSAAPACGVPVSVQTPEAKRAYTADQVVIRLNELENAAIQANGAGALPDGPTRQIVTFVVDADTTAKAAPLGWQATIGGGWQTLRHQLPATLPPTVQTAIAVIDALLAQGGQ